MASHSSRRSSKGDTRWENGTMIPLPGKTSWRETNPSEEYRPWSFSIQSHLQSIRNAIAAGVPLLCGTDLPPADAGHRQPDHAARGRPAGHRAGNEIVGGGGPVPPRRPRDGDGQPGEVDGRR